MVPVAVKTNFCTFRMVNLQKNDHIVISQLHQSAPQKNWVSMEAINARNLILVSLALSAVLLELAFKSSLPCSMSASTQWGHSSLLLSHSVCLVRIFTFQAVQQEIRCKYFVLCSFTVKVEDKIEVLKCKFINPWHL
jgi:hypothetical protein